jgi:hypothetical protein
MKALNHKEITNRYLIFLANFTLLLACTVLCWYLYLKTCDVQAAKILEKKNEYDFIFNKQQELSNKIDSLNKFLNMLNTDQVENEVALERTILKIKNETSRDFDVLEANGDKNYVIFKKIIDNIEKAIDNKKALQQAILDEETQKRKLVDCIDANKKVKKELISTN